MSWIITVNYQLSTGIATKNENVQKTQNKNMTI